MKASNLWHQREGFGFVFSSRDAGMTKMHHSGIFACLPSS